jgi:hypothetical protein
MRAIARLVTSLGLVALMAGTALGQAQAPTTKAPPPARTPSAIIGPPTGLPRVGDPATAPVPRTTPVPRSTREVDPATNAPTSTPPPDTPPALVPPSSPPGR